MDSLCLKVSELVKLLKKSLIERRVEEYEGVLADSSLVGVSTSEELVIVEFVTCRLISRGK